MPIDPESFLPEGWEDWSVEQKEYALRKIKYEWRFFARPEQIPPKDLVGWMYFVYLAGRGAGKTRTGAEWVKSNLLEHAGWRAGIIAPSYGAARDVCLEGDSGLLSVLPEEEIKKYNRSLGQVVLKNGSRVQTFSGNDPERLRGPQHHIVWMDEICAYQYLTETHDMAIMGNRLGTDPKFMITTTPKPVALIKEFVKRAADKDPLIYLVTGSTFDNAENLAKSTLDALLARYAGTSIGEQELYAKLILDAAGALWTRNELDEDRVGRADAPPDIGGARCPDLVRIVVAIDPSVSMGHRSNETGVIVAGLGVDGHGYVLEDCTVAGGSPEVWAQAAYKAYLRYKADRIVAEANNGGLMVESTIRTVDPQLPVKIVYASRGKLTRAEPISALYEQHKIHHVGLLGELEDQLCEHVFGVGESPDRLDALVWAMTELMLKGGMAEVYGPSVDVGGPVPSASGAVWTRGGPTGGPEGASYADSMGRTGAPVVSNEYFRPPRSDTFSRHGRS